jgi:hypothetical protein
MNEERQEQVPARVTNHSEQNSEPIMLNLALKEDTSCVSDQTIYDIFGDSFLYRNNLIHRNVRKKVISMGATFAIDQSGHYFSAPLLMLSRIVGTKNIPFFPTGAVLRDLCLKNISIKLEDLKFLGLTKNYVTHESAHIIFDEEHQKHEANLSTESERVLAILLGESFANTVETLAYLFDCGSKLETYFIEQNYYHRKYKTDYLNAASNLRNLTKGALLPSAILFGFLVSNFGYFRAESSQIRSILKVLDLLGFETPSENQFSHFSYVVMNSTLNMNFTFGTTQLYMNILGFQGTLEEITDFCPFKILLEKPASRSLLATTIQNLKEIMHG